MLPQGTWETPGQLEGGVWKNPHLHLQGQSPLGREGRVPGVWTPVRGSVAMAVRRVACSPSTAEATVGPGGTAWRGKQPNTLLLQVSMSQAPTEPRHHSLLPQRQGSWLHAGSRDDTSVCSHAPCEVAPAGGEGHEPRPGREGPWRRARSPLLQGSRECPHVPQSPRTEIWKTVMQFT